MYTFLNSLLTNSCEKYIKTRSQCFCLYVRTETLDTDGVVFGQRGCTVWLTGVEESALKGSFILQPVNDTAAEFRWSSIKTSSSDALG